MWRNVHPAMTMAPVSALRLLIVGQPIAVGINHRIHQRPYLIRSNSAAVWGQHGSVVNIFSLAEQSRLDRQRCTLILVCINAANCGGIRPIFVGCKPFLSANKAAQRSSLGASFGSDLIGHIAINHTGFSGFHGVDDFSLYSLELVEKPPHSIIGLHRGFHPVLRLLPPSIQP